MRKHTPTPWTKHPYSKSAPSEVTGKNDKTWTYHHATIGRGEKMIAQVLMSTGAGGYSEVDNIPEFEANVEFILRACNAHEELLAALKDVNENTKDDSPDMWQRVEDAIAKAEGRKP